MSGGAPRPAAPEPLRCGRRRPAGGPGGGGGAAAVAVAVARRNERERNRVRRVNLGFQALRLHVPRGAGRKLSKAETLRSAAAYIAALQRLLAEHDAAGRPAGLLAPAPRPAPAPAAAPAPAPGRGGSSEPGSPRSASSSDDSGCEGAPSPAGRELLGLSGWLGGC